MAADLSPEQKSLLSRIGAHQSWANTPDRSARTAPARRSFLERFEREVDPNGELDPVTRRQRAESARKAHMSRLALASARARAARKSA